MEALLNKNENFKSFFESNNEKISYGTLTLDEISELNMMFNIPIYQRLYVWKVGQIRTLLEDIKNSFQKDENHNFYLGGVMLSSTKTNQFDLIDGQQRFTTLWLLCDFLSISHPFLKSFTFVSNNEPRICFSIRENAQLFFKDKTLFYRYINDNGEVIKEFENEISEIIPLIEAYQLIKEILAEFQKEDFDLQKFSKYITSKITLTYTIVPASTDMNRLFEAMNNRGKQLEHHELLKSRLLHKLNPEEQFTYALIWDACSNMNSYIEKSIKDVTNLTWKNLYGNENIEHQGSIILDNTLELQFEKIRILLEKQEKNTETTISLKAILESKTELNTNSESEKIAEDVYLSKSVKSIIGFPTFLLHVFRVYQINNNIDTLNTAEVNDKKLLDIFNVQENFKTSTEVQDFIKLLWETRVLFDKHIIKWIYTSDNNDEFHSIENVYISKSAKKNTDTISIQRNEATDETTKCLIKLQGMLYHSQEITTQYWITPFLHYLVTEQKTNEQILNRLELLENALFYSKSNINKLKDRTYSIVTKNLNEELNHLIDTKSYLSEFLGTNYPSYIFYKLEYILWKNRIDICKKHDLNIRKWDEFRLTSKNSVEHVFPQKQKEENKHIEYISPENLGELKLEKKHPIDDFGNLVLLSPGMNSQYSNMPYQQKKGKYDSKTEIDSLKSDLIFKNTDWNWEAVLQHRNEMIKIIDEYINNLKSIE